MPRDPQSALEHELLSNQVKDGDEYTFNLGELSQPITIRLSRARKGVWYEQSHFIKTPGQAMPHKTSGPRGEDEHDALRKAVWDLLGWYQGAVNDGHQPEDAWLVPNDDF